MQKIIVNIIAALLAKLGGYLIDLVTDIIEEAKIKRKQEKKKKAMDNAKDPESIKDAHRNNTL